MHTSTCASHRQRKRKKCGDQIRASAWRVQSPPKKNANPPAANSFPRSSAGWSTSTPSSKKQKTSGQYNARPQHTQTERVFSTQHSAKQRFAIEIGNRKSYFVTRKSYFVLAPQSTAT